MKRYMFNLIFTLVVTLGVNRKWLVPIEDWYGVMDYPQDNKLFWLWVRLYIRLWGYGLQNRFADKFKYHPILPSMEGFHCFIHFCKL